MRGADASVQPHAELIAEQWSRSNAVEATKPISQAIAAISQVLRSDNLPAEPRRSSDRAARARFNWL